MNPTPMINAGLILNGLRYWLTGGMRIKNGHLPVANHTIVADFLGVCVASCGDSKGDDFIIEKLLELGVQRVRFDVREGDLTVLKCQFLEKLFNQQFKVCLHIVQPFSQAREMHQTSALQDFSAFLQQVIHQFGSKIAALEFATTINRKTWAGYTQTGFLAAWQVVYTQCKAANIVLIGPNVQDFEPFYNSHILKKLSKYNQLPNMQSNNLFAERTIEPERFDHRVFKYSWTRWFKINLIKKARIIQKIGAEVGVPQLVSSNAFWAIFRISRLLPDVKQKQADYLTRYFVLLAASGAVTHTNWGALICQREGLLDNGLTDADYPPLEQVAYYDATQGHHSQFKPNPSFFALKTVAKFLQNATYSKAIASTDGLEIHEINLAGQFIHIAWTINARAAFLDNIYQADSLKSAQFVHRDGQDLPPQTFITETPIYLIFSQPPALKQAAPALPQALIMHRHVANLQYFRVQQSGWDGLILANNQQEADLITEQLNPETLQIPTKELSLRHARNAIWAMDDPRKNKENQQLTIKKPVKMYWHKALLDRFKPSKAKRSWNGAMHLMRCGIATAPPVAYFEKVGDTSCKQNFYVCERVPAKTNVGQLFRNFSAGETQWNGFSRDVVIKAVAAFCLNLHQHLIWFRDLSGGNILVDIVDNQLTFSLIDTARLRAITHTPFPHQYRMNDMARVCQKLNWPLRKQLMQHYFAPINKQFTQADQFKCWLYDAKVSLKRTIGRKGIKKLKQKLFSNKA